jgi:hypothetical protein
LKLGITVTTALCIFATGAFAQSSIDLSSCQTVHAGGQLIYDKGYAFNLDFDNNSSVPKFLNRFDVDYADASVPF